MLKHDLAAARAAWLGEAADPPERAEREGSDVLVYRDREGRVADFHALRHTFITRLVKAGVKPKDAQALGPVLDRYAAIGSVRPIWLRRAAMSRGIADRAAIGRKAPAGRRFPGRSGGTPAPAGW